MSLSLDIRISCQRLPHVLQKSLSGTHKRSVSTTTVKVGNSIAGLELNKRLSWCVVKVFFFFFYVDFSVTPFSLCISSQVSLRRGFSSDAGTYSLPCVFFIPSISAVYFFLSFSFFFPPYKEKCIFHVATACCLHLWQCCKTGVPRTRPMAYVIITFYFITLCSSLLLWPWRI